MFASSHPLPTWRASFPAMVGYGSKGKKSLLLAGMRKCDAEIGKCVLRYIGPPFLEVHKQYAVSSDCK